MPPPSMADAGAELFVLQGCPSCHASGAEQRGPRLERVFGSTVRLADGRRVGAPVFDLELLTD